MPVSRTVKIVMIYSSLNLLRFTVSDPLRVGPYALVANIPGEHGSIVQRHDLLGF